MMEAVVCHPAQRLLLLLLLPLPLGYTGVARRRPRLLVGEEGIEKRLGRWNSGNGVGLWVPLLPQPDQASLCERRGGRI